MTPEQNAQARVDNERARRIAIQSTVSRRVDDRVRMLDPAFRLCDHAEHVRRMVVQLGDIGARDPGTEGLQEALTDLAADVQALLEANLRDAEEDARDAAR